MSTSTQPTDYQDLYSSLIEKVRENSTTALITVAKQYIQSAHMDIYVGNGEKFHWAERRAFITTHEPYSTGTVSLTQGSFAVTGSGTAWNTANDQGQTNVRVGGKMVFDGTDTVYEVSAVSGDTSINIDPEYAGSTDTGVSYRYFEDEYALADDFWKPVDQRQFDDFNDIRLIGRSDFRRWFPRNHIPQQHVKAATLIDRSPTNNTTPIRKILFAPPPSSTKVIPYSYVTANIVVSSTGDDQTEFSAATDEPTMPLRYRHLIVLKALHSWYRDRKDDPRADAAWAEFQSLLDRIIGDTDIGQQRLRIGMNRNAYRARAKRPWGRGTSRLDVNNDFDFFRDRGRW